MASHVVVIDSSARRAMVKTTPSKYISDVLDEACSKLGLTASQYGLKNNNKPVDLSRTIRLSGLSSGAKLELVQLSKSAGVVSVALQLPDSEGNVRLTDRFPSTTTLWLVLRKFEAGVAGGGAGAKSNLTARAAPSVQADSSGAGRLYYQQPVLQVMGRELSSFTDLQRTLAQLGFNSGTTLLRLTFRTSETPLEEAMAQIENYFKSVDGPVSQTEVAPTSALQPESQASEQSPIPEWTAEEAHSPPASEAAQRSQEPESPQHTINHAAQLSPTISAAGRPISVFAPPSTSTPSASATPHNPSDYIPTIEHAQTHQRMLSHSSRNRPLPTNAQIAAQEQAEQEKLATIKDVEVKIRFPDQSSVSSRFVPGDSGRSLYGFVRECLDVPLQNERFILKIPGVKSKGDGVVPDTDQKKLIKDIGMRGRVLVVFSWTENASAAARAAKEVLKQELRAQAKAIEVQEVKVEDDGDEGTKINVSKLATGEADEKAKKKGGVPKWLKGLNKK